MARGIVVPLFFRSSLPPPPDEKEDDARGKGDNDGNDADCDADGSSGAQLFRGGFYVGLVGTGTSGGSDSHSPHCSVCRDSRPVYGGWIRFFRV